MNHKISLFTNNVLVFPHSGQMSLSETKTHISKFSIISDFSINCNKSAVLLINSEQSTLTAQLQSSEHQLPGYQFPHQAVCPDD